MKRIGLLIVVLSMLGTAYVETHGGGGGGFHGGGHGGGFHGGGHGGWSRGGGWGRGGYYGGGYWGGGIGTGLVAGTLIGAAAASSSDSSSNRCDRLRNPLSTYTNRFGSPRATQQSWKNYQDWLANGCQG